MATEQTDVKEIKEESSTPTPSKEADVKEASEKEASFEELIGEKDKTIPYAVFKERNEKLRETERKVKSMEKMMETKINEAVAKTSEQYRAYYEQQMMALQQQQQQINPYDYADPSVAKEVEYKKYANALETKIAQLESKFSSLNENIVDRDMKSQVSQLKSIYPMLDEEHVYAVKKVRPESDLEEIAKYSHDKFSTVTKSLFDKMVEQKKQAAKPKVIGSESKAVFKPAVAPKTFKDARKMASDYLKQIGE